ncbi:MAG: hypothetical protein ACREVY_18055 [Gammaproteobacteria bacterium]
MDIKPIKSQGDYKRTLRAIEQLWEAKPDTPSSLTAHHERSRLPSISCTISQ